MRYSIAAFRTDTRDKVVRTGSVFSYENAGELSSHGVELGLNFEFENGFHGALNYTRQISEWREWTRSGTSYEDKDLTLVPRDLFGISAGYRHPVLGDLSVYVNYTGSKYLDSGNTRELSDHTIVNFKYAKRFRSLKPEIEIYLSGENITDEEYIEVGWAGSGWEEFYPMPGRSFLGGINFYF